jgi:Autographiviridae endonuclease
MIAKRVAHRRCLADYPTPTPQPTPCRLWQGSIIPPGYGKRPDHELVHRWVWRLAVGPIPEGMQVLHHCDQPLCFRLDHLYLGTQLDNIADMKRRGRARNKTSGPLTKNGATK